MEKKLIPTLSLALQIITEQVFYKRNLQSFIRLYTVIEDIAIMVGIASFGIFLRIIINNQKLQSKIMKPKLLLSLFIVLFITGEVGAQIDGGATTQTKNLYHNLKDIAWNGKEILFGQEFYNSYSFAIDDQKNPDCSDYKDVTGDHPALLGQDFHYYITKGSVERARHKKAAQFIYKKGGVLTFDFHMYSKYHEAFVYEESDKYLMYNIAEGINDKQEVTWFNNQLQDAVDIINELKIPVVVRLFHEMNGNWFWWGTKAEGGKESYIKLYQYAVNYIKARTDYALFAWSPNYRFDSGNYPGTNYYPGDDFVDVVGVDFYDAGSSKGKSFETLVQEVTAVSDFSLQHNKIPVLAEIGNRFDGPDDKPNWWMEVNQHLQESERGFKIAYILTWINKPWGGGETKQPYVAYSGSTAEAKKGLITFKSMPTIYNLKDAKKLQMYKSKRIKKDNNAIMQTK
ncbi:MAG: hypothetical protein RLZZ540_395 [Bacteroidota bacterium]